MIRLESDVGWLDEGFHLLCCLGAKHKGNQRVGIAVALQQMHVLISTISRGLRIEEIRITVCLLTDYESYYRCDIAKS